MKFYYVPILTAVYDMHWKNGGFDMVGQVITFVVSNKKTTDFLYFD